MFRDQLLKFLLTHFELIHQKAIPALTKFERRMTQRSFPTLAHRSARVSFCSDGAIVFFTNGFQFNEGFTLIDDGVFDSLSMVDRWNALCAQLFHFIDPVSGMGSQVASARFLPFENSDSVQISLYILNSNSVWTAPVTKVLFFGKRYFDVHSNSKLPEQLAQEFVEKCLEDAASSIHLRADADPWKSLREYKSLLETAEREEDLQVFLTKHPEILFPGYVSVRPTFSLGAEFVTDFLSQTIGGVEIETWLVEIESPQKELFTRKGQLRSEVIQAQSQLLNWKEWVTRHHAYLRDAVSNFSTNPKYLLVMGRDHHLDDHAHHLQSLFQEPFAFMTFDALATRYGAIPHRLSDAGIIAKEVTVTSPA